MPRIPRNYMIASFFHIMVQGINQEYIFDNEANMKKYIKLLEEKREEEIIILAYCIMNNHAHILVKIKDVKYLEKWMSKVNTTFARYYNKKNERVGHVFRNRYKSQQIKDAKYLYNCIQYIHNNPIKANICKNQEEYEYSSFKHIYKSKTKNVINVVKSVTNSGYLSNKELSDEPLMIFLEDNQSKEEVCTEVINIFKHKYNTDMKEIIKNKYILGQLVKTLKVDFEVSYRVIEKQIGIGRETLRKLLIEINKEGFDG